MVRPAGLALAGAVRLAGLQEAHEVAHRDVAEAQHQRVACPRRPARRSSPARSLSGYECARPTGTIAYSAPWLSSPLPPSTRANIQASGGTGMRASPGVAPPRQARLARVERHRRMAARGGAARQRHGRDAVLVGDVFDAHLARDRLAVVGRHRHVEQEAMVAGQQIGLPSGPGERIAAPHHEAVAGMRGRARIVGAHRVVEELQAADVAAIAPVEEQPAVALRRIDGLQDRDIGRRSAPARPASTGGLVEIDDARLRRRLRDRRQSARGP